MCNMPVKPENLNRVDFVGKSTTEKWVTVDAESRRGKNELDVGVRNGVSAIDATGSFGSKIDFMVRHILFLKRKDPKVKCIVFSQWKPLLDIVGKALDYNDVRWVALEGRDRADSIRRFKTETKLTVCLLRSKNQSRLVDAL